MNDVINLLKEKKAFVSMQAVNEEQIQDAEGKLNLSFSEEYHQYVSTYGAASFYGHELTGICDAQQINVVLVTKAEREFNPTVPQNWYVIEQANIDGIVIWQDETGAIYQTMPNAKPMKLCNSLAEYIEM